MSTPINNNGTVFNQVWDNLNQGGYQAAQSHGRPQIQAVNPHNMMYGAQGSYEDHQAYKDMSSRTVVPSATITRPLLPAQTPLMECYSWCNNSNKQHETINSSRFHPQTNNGQYYPQTNNGQYYPQTYNGQYYPQTNNGLVVNNVPYSHQHTTSTSSTSLQNNSYQTSPSSLQIQRTHSQTKHTGSPFAALTRELSTPKGKTPALTYTLRSESATTPKEKTPALTHALRSEPATTPKEKTPALTYTLRSESATTPKEKTSFTKKRKPAQSRKVPSVRAELALKNISSPKAPSIQERHHEPIPVKDVMLPKPPSVTNIEEAKKLLKEEYKNQLQDIENLRIDKQYERKQKGLWDHTERIEEGARKKEFKDDLCLQLENGNFKIDQCHTPEDINKAFQDQWTSMKTLGVYRHWCLRKAAPNNPLPHYPGRVSIRNTGNSCGPDASIIQLLHSGTMNYFIFRPIKEETDRNNWNDHKNNIDHQKEWQRLYQKILFGSTAGGEIDVPDWIRLDFYGMDGYIQVNSYIGTFFDKDIVWKPKEPLKRLDSPGADTRRKLEERILGDWRACRLHTGSWHYTTLIKDEHDEITSIDSGVVKRKIYNSPRELLDLFLSGRKPYDDPSRIDFWE